MGLGNTIVDENDASNQDRAKAMIFLRRHLDEGLKVEYLTVKDPLVLWRDLKERFDHLKLQQYRERGFKKYSELIACLLLAEQNNELLLKNHESRPTGASPFPEANGTQFQNSGRGRGRGRRGGRGRSRGRGRGRGRDHSRFVPRENYSRGHWSRTCRTAEHLVDLYQASLKKKDKDVETNFIDQKNAYDDDDADMTHLDIADFFEHPEDAK
ncbi:double-strand break repair protein MRE11-like [Coffea eugenioides]|uniref:double-strand break repair protein MRE11-like n=1 Tax=Coffea eugenioides TaxID=49369 RepID=UPI000F614C66|nr:double-strand break repair protein MRE11-like [Coffea eugenioides]